MKHRINSQKLKVEYTKYEKNKDVIKYLEQLSKISKLNLLLEKKLISELEYEKVKCAIEKNA